MKYISLTALISSLTLSACFGPIQGSIHSGAHKLDVGMTPSQVTEIIGAYQFEVSAGNTTCRSYIYDEAIGAKFVHAVFVDGALSKASDGHRTACKL